MERERELYLRVTHIFHKTFNEATLDAQTFECIKFRSLQKNIKEAFFNENEIFQRDRIGCMFKLMRRLHRKIETFLMTSETNKIFFINRISTFSDFFWISSIFR